MQMSLSLWSSKYSQSTKMSLSQLDNLIMLPHLVFPDFLAAVEVFVFI